MRTSRLSTLLGLTLATYAGFKSGSLLNASLGFMAGWSLPKVVTLMNTFFQNVRRLSEDPKAELLEFQDEDRSTLNAMMVAGGVNLITSTMHDADFLLSCLAAPTLLQAFKQIPMPDGKKNKANHNDSNIRRWGQRRRSN